MRCVLDSNSGVKWLLQEGQAWAPLSGRLSIQRIGEELVLDSPVQEPLLESPGRYP
jgi:hypothetical protein